MNKVSAVSVFTGATVGGFSLLIGMFLAFLAFAPLRLVVAVAGLTLVDSVRFFSIIVTPLGRMPMFGIWGMVFLAVALSILPLSIAQGRKLNLSRRKVLIGLFSVVILSSLLASSITPAL